MTHDLYLDKPQIQALSRRLRDLSGWAAEALDDTICRIVAHDRAPSRSGDRPLELNETASDIAGESLGTLRAWAEHICAHSTVAWPGEQRIAGWARFLDRHLVDLAKTEQAGQAVDEISDVHKRIMRIIDRPEAPEFVGPCQAPRDAQNACAGVYCPRGRDTTHCRTCDLDIDIPTVRAATEEAMRGHRFTKVELRTALLRFTTRPVSRGLIDGWIRRKRLIASADGKFALNEALELLAQRDSA